jgi:hypothetical protein
MSVVGNQKGSGNYLSMFRSSLTPMTKIWDQLNATTAYLIPPFVSQAKCRLIASFRAAHPLTQEENRIEERHRQAWQ